MDLESKVARQIIREIPKTADMVVRVSRAEVDGVVWLDIRDYSILTDSYQRGVTVPWPGTAIQAPKNPRLVPGGTPEYQNEVLCRRCGRLVGYSESKRPVRMQCPDTSCMSTQAATVNEDRDSVVELMFAIGIPPEEIGKAVGVTRQRVMALLS